MLTIRSHCSVTALLCLVVLDATAQLTVPGQAVYDNAGTAATTALWQDAHLNDAGGANDMSVAIQQTLINNCVTSTATLLNQGCAVKAGYPGLQAWSIDPFEGTGMPNGGDIDLCSAGVTDIRASKTIVLSDGLHVHGCGETTPDDLQSPASPHSPNYNNTIIRACNPSFLSGEIYGTACTPSFGLAVPTETLGNNSVSCTAGLCSVTVNNTLSDGQDVFIYDGTGSGAITGHFLVASIIIFGGMQTGFTIATSSSMGTFSCAASCGTVYEGTPLIRIQNGQSFHTELDHLTLDCAWVRGCIPFVNVTGEEQTTAHDLEIVNFGGEAIRIDTSDNLITAYGGTSSTIGAINSGPYWQMSIHPQLETCELQVGLTNGCYGGSGGGGVLKNTNFDGASLAGVPQVLNCSTFGILATGNKIADVRGFHAITITGFSAKTGTGAIAPQLLSTGWTAGTSCISGTNAPGNINSGGPYAGSAMGFFVYGATNHISDFHVEYMPTGVEVGGNTNINAYWPGGVAANIVVENTEVCEDSCFASSPKSYDFDIGPGATDITFRNVTGDATDTHLLHDNVTGNICGALTGDSQQSIYILGHGSPPYVQTNCTGLTNQLVGPLALNSVSGGGSVTIAQAATGSATLTLPIPTGGVGTFAVGASSPLSLNSTTGQLSCTTCNVLSSLTAATAANTIGNGTNTQTWQWAFTGSGQSGMVFDESAAATAASDILNIQTTTASAAVPLLINQGTESSGTGITSNVHGVDIETKWNNSGITFDAPLFMNVTNTASNAASVLADFQLGSTTKWKVDETGKVSQAGITGSYNGVSTIGNGVPAEYGNVDVTLQSLATGGTLYAVPSAGSGMYRISWSAKVTRAGTTSSLGGTNGFQITYTDADDSVSATSQPSVTSTGNTTATQISGVVVVNAKASTNISYTFGYSSTGGTSMQYSLHIKIEAM